LKFKSICFFNKQEKLGFFVEINLI